MTKETRMHNGEKTASSINGIGKTGQVHAKGTGQPSHFMYKNKLEMDWRLKCKTPNHKISRRKDQQYVLWHQSYQCSFGYVSSGKGNKSKNKQMGLHQTEMPLHSKENY